MTVLMIVMMIIMIFVTAHGRTRTRVIKSPVRLDL